MPDRPVEAFEMMFDLGWTAKAPLLEDDPKERSETLVFEYGHTVGHALEAASAGSMSHGEAVAWGMLMAAEVSAKLGHLDQAALDDHYRVLPNLELPAARTAL